MFPLRDHFIIENKCSHCALRLILIGKDTQRKGKIRHVRNWSQAISSNFSCLFRSKIAKIAKDKCSHCAMDLYYCFRWLSTAPSHKIITLWVHPFRLNLSGPIVFQETHRRWSLPCDVIDFACLDFLGNSQTLRALIMMS